MAAHVAGGVAIGGVDRLIAEPPNELLLRKAFDQSYWSPG